MRHGRQHRRGQSRKGHAAPVHGALSAHEHHHDGGHSERAETQPLRDRSPRRHPRPRGKVGAEDDRDWVKPIDGLLLYNSIMAIATQEILVDVTRTLNRLTSLCKEHYGERLISLAVFGSVGRGTARPDSDIDFLLVVKNLPNGRMARVGEFSAIETALDIKGHLELSPVFKTPEEIADGSPLLLDMVEDARVLFDREDFFKHAMEDLKKRLQRLNARRVWQGNAWYWDLKPDYKQGEVFEI